MERRVTASISIRTMTARILLRTRLAVDFVKFFACSQYAIGLLSPPLVIYRV
jgi:hypothetical protein